MSNENIVENPAADRVDAIVESLRERGAGNYNDLVIELLNTAVARFDEQTDLALTRHCLGPMVEVMTAWAGGHLSDRIVDIVYDSVRRTRTEWTMVPHLLIETLVVKSTWHFKMRGVDHRFSYDYLADLIAGVTAVESDNRRCDPLITYAEMLEIWDRHQ